MSNKRQLAELRTELEVVKTALAAVQSGPQEQIEAEQRAAKHAYSVHQDNLFWSRVQTLIAIQTATLAGAYHLAYSDKPDLLASWSLTVLGLVLTGVLWILAERDQLHRHGALLESGVPETTIEPESPFKLKGGLAVRIVIVLLAYADLIVPLSKSTGESDFRLGLFVLAALGAGTVCYVDKRAIVERRQLRIKLRQANRRAGHSAGRSAGPRLS